LNPGDGTTVPTGPVAHAALLYIGRGVDHWLDLEQRISVGRPVYYMYTNGIIPVCYLNFPSVPAWHATG